MSKRTNLKATLAAAAPAAAPAAASALATILAPAAPAAAAPGVLTDEAKAILATCTSLAGAYLAGAADVDAAKAAVGEAESGQLQRVRDALAGVEPITGPRWKAVYASPVRMALKASGTLADASVGMAVNRLKVAAIALTHDILPEPRESLKAFTGRIKDVLKAQGLYEPENSGDGAAAREARAGKAAEAAASVVEDETAAPTSRFEAAALLLANGDLADAELFKIISVDREIRKAVRALVAKIAPKD